MRIAVTIVIEMTDAQVDEYADEYELRRPDGRVMARDVVEHVRRWLLSDVARGPLGDQAGVSLKER